MIRITDDEKVEIPTLANVFSALSIDANCCAAFAAIGKPNTHFNVNSDKVLVRASPLDGASQ